MRYKALLIITCITMSGCAARDNSYQSYLNQKGITAPTTEHFQHCHGYGCQQITDIKLSAADWKIIDTVFAPPAQNAEDERIKIAQAIGLFEQKVGKVAGTQNDRYGTFRKIGIKQLDCVDESINTTIYLSLLQSKNHLKHHTIEKPNVRLPLINSGRWPHQTAVIRDNTTNQRYVVDSWFHDNGYAAEIVPLKAWKDGWKPAAPKRHGDSSHKGE